MFRRLLSVAAVLVAGFIVVLSNCSKKSEPTAPIGDQDTIRPFITSILPDSTNYNVAPDVALFIQFSEAIAAQSVDSESVRLETAGGSLVASDLSVDGSQLQLKPLAPLDNNRSYYLTIHNTVKDLDGNSLKEKLSYSFRTEPYTTDSPDTWVRIPRNPSVGSFGATCVVVRQSGDYVIAGYDSRDICVGSLDSVGEFTWMRRFHDEEHTYFVYDLVEGFNGALAILGDQDSVAFLKVLSVEGDPISHATITGGGQCFGRSLLSVSTSDYLVCGTAVPNGEYYSSAYISKRNYYGTLDWEQSYQGDQPNTWFNGNSIALTEFSDLVVVGYQFNYAENKDRQFAFLTDISGNVEWDSAFGLGRLYDVVGTSEGNFVATGIRWDDADMPIMIAIKFDNAGGLIWEKDLGTGIGRSIIISSDGNCTISGSAGDINEPTATILVKVALSGEIIWRKELPLFGLGYDLVECSDGGFLVASGTYIFKTDPAGQL